jgi:anti-sigma regulatory factor (Ser/Thr protein kinase)
MMLKSHLKADKFIQSSFRNLLQREFKDLGETNLFNIALATGEALQNIVRYGYAFQDHKEVRISLDQIGDRFVIEIIDDAPPCPVENFMQHQFTPSDHGGMGIAIIKKLTQIFEIKPLAQGNLTSLVFKLNI